MWFNVYKQEISGRINNSSIDECSQSQLLDCEKFKSVEIYEM